MFNKNKRLSFMKVKLLILLAESFIKFNLTFSELYFWL